MSIPVLIQTYEEVRRLAIAGSAVARGDYRLKKLLSPLEQAAQKAPVFAKVGEAVQRLVESSEKTSGAALLELATLINAILYTQGETGIAGELVPIKSVELGRLRTQASARVLKPLQEALTSTGSGRLEIIRDALERGTFQDLRLVAPALAALDDKNADIADLVADRILPIYGPAIVPALQAKLDIKGHGGHVRRLVLMHRLDPETARPSIRQALDDGSREMRVAAIGCLGDSPDDLPFLLAQVKAKAREVRTAVLKALGKCEMDAAARVLCEAISGADLPLAVEPIRNSRHPLVTVCLLQEAAKQFDALITGKERDVQKLGQQNERMTLLLECLRGREDAKTGELLLRMFQCIDKLATIKGEPGGKDVVERLVVVMANGPGSVRSALIDAHAMLPAESLPQAFAAACRCREPAEVFALFSPYLGARVDDRKKQREPTLAKREAIIDLLLQGRRGWFHDPQNFAATANLDPQWLDLAIQLGRADLVQALAVPGHAGTHAFLAKIFEDRLGKTGDDHELVGIVHTMIRVGHPAATDATIEVIRRFARAKYVYAPYWLGYVIPRLPKAEALPKLEALLPSLPEKMIDQLLDCLTALKTATTT